MLQPRVVHSDEHHIIAEVESVIVLVIEETSMWVEQSYRKANAEVPSARELQAAIEHVRGMLPRNSSSS